LGPIDAANGDLIDRILLESLQLMLADYVTHINYAITKQFNFAN